MAWLQNHQRYQPQVAAVVKYRQSDRILVPERTTIQASRTVCLQCLGRPSLATRVASR
ncbi:hypothetical protein JMJ77_0006057 [Colletotrichum scovillei]|uniref:Uncharacterized protein n=1 Tax=Colletotrichum scovillei TaxID=1209932 RepID=A0A9P7RL02_9PEZI|nr:hypothetical protein JMJ77_0006057 [Colletotrichum scovillei]KAG7077202.1 hypothetical protein JMJ76_0014452 [Colletotrichum scovillei]KAG7084401.1 hypothetical protein JMJ78_0009837 [Colletotrichum scovillei]